MCGHIPHKLEILCVCACVCMAVRDFRQRHPVEIRAPTASGLREVGLELGYSLCILLGLRRSVSNRSCFRNRPGLCGDTHLSAKPAGDVAATGPAHRQEPCGRRPARFWTRRLLSPVGSVFSRTADSPLDQDLDLPVDVVLPSSLDSSVDLDLALVGASSLDLSLELDLVLFSLVDLSLNLDLVLLRFLWQDVSPDPELVLLVSLELSPDLDRVLVLFSFIPSPLSLLELPVLLEESVSPSYLLAAATRLQTEAVLISCDG